MVHGTPPPLRASIEKKRPYKANLWAYSLLMQSVMPTGTCPRQLTFFLVGSRKKWTSAIITVMTLRQCAGEQVCCELSLNRTTWLLATRGGTRGVQLRHGQRGCNPGTPIGRLVKIQRVPLIRGEGVRRQARRTLRVAHL